MYCFNCGSEVDNSARFCAICGVNLRPVSLVAPRREAGPDDPTVRLPPPTEADPTKTLDIPRGSDRHPASFGNSPGPAAGGAAGQSAFPPPDAANLSPGDTLLAGRYSVVRRLGRGGMGVVYEITDHRMRDKRFALKALSPAMSAEPGALDTLLAEVLTAQGLHHPNIIAVHDMVDDLGTLFIKMELIEGETLREIQRREGPIPLDRVLDWMLQSCDGLAYAHDQHIIHADIKPANIMITAGGQIKLADFGLSVVLDEQYSHYSLGGIQAGTINYMSPEQYMGLRLSRRSDVYSLACSMWSLLAGKPPFGGASLQYQLLHQPPPPVPDVPDWLNEVLLVGLAKDDRARPADMRHFRMMLEQGTVRPIKPRTRETAAHRAVSDTDVVDPDSTGMLSALPGPAADLAALSNASAHVSWASSRDESSATMTPVVPPDDLHSGAFTLLGMQEFRCPNNVEGERVSRMAVYRCRAFADALGLAVGVTAPEVEFVLLPPPGKTGRYVMGSPLTEPHRGPDEVQHEVFLQRPFLMARTAVSQRLYAALSSPSTLASDAGELPACSVAWTTAVHWLRRQGLRLPSESEWEFACRGGTTTPFCTGNSLPAGFSNYDINYPYHGGSGQAPPTPLNTGTWRQRMVGVAEFGTNAFGLHHMHGNVCEWVADCYCGNYDPAPIDGSPLEAPGIVQRVIRGGSWTHLAQACRSAARFPCDPGFVSRLVGFRAACSADLQMAF